MQCEERVISWLNVRETQTSACAHQKINKLWSRIKSGTADLQWFDRSERPHLPRPALSQTCSRRIILIHCILSHWLRHGSRLLFCRRMNLSQGVNLRAGTKENMRQQESRGDLSIFNMDTSVSVSVWNVPLMFTFQTDRVVSQPVFRNT